MEKVIMPMLGETMNEGIIAKWRKQEGEKVERGEILLEVTTDKATLEVESLASGVLRKIVAPEGSTIPVLQTIAWIGAANEQIPEETSDAQVVKEKVTEKSVSKGPVAEQKTESADTARVFSRPTTMGTPAARRVAKELGVNLEDVKGTGPGGRITEDDVRNFAAKKGTEKGTVPREKVSAGTIPLTSMRKVIADRMSKSKREAPHYYIKMSIDMSEVVKLRNSLLPDYQKTHGIKLAYDDIILKAVSIALTELPLVNASFTAEGIKIHEKVNIGIAVALTDGLIVPVIKEANKKSLLDIAKERDRLVKKARENKLLPDEYSGGTFTVSNLGMFGVDEFIAIINPPESAILAISKIEDKPVVTGGGEIHVRPIVNFTVSSDHRVIDGALAAQFLQRVKQILESPSF